MTQTSQSPGQPLLTIAIPTYNRADCLNLLLSELTKQITDDSVELIVSDNASSDDTSNVVESFVRQGAKICYMKNLENTGPDGNILQCYNLARGEYVWVVGDDDVIIPGALRRILGVLGKREFDLVYVSSYRFRDEYRPLADSMLKGKTTMFSNATDYALRICTGLTFISGNIIRKDKVEATPHSDFRELVGTNLVQLSWMYTLLSGQPKCIWLRDKLIANKTENTGGFGTCQVFGENIRTIVRQFLGEESRTGRALINRNLQSFLPWAIVQDRSGKSVRNLPESRDAFLYNLYRRNGRYWFFLWPAIKLPLPFAKAWLFLVKIINRIDQALEYPIAR